MCDVGFESSHVRFVAGTAYVGGVFLVEFHEGLRGNGDFGGLEGGNCVKEGFACGSVGSGEGIGRYRRWRNMEICDYLKLFVEMVEGHNGIEEHE